MNKIKRTFKRVSKTNNFMILLTSSSSIIGNALSIIGGLLALKWLLPYELGYFNTFTVITGYIVLAHMGTPVALNRDLPYLIGKGKKNEALKLAAVAKFWTILISSVISVMGILGIIYFLLHKKYQLAAGIFVIVAQAWHGIYVMKYLKILYRTNKDFNKLALIGLAVATISFISIYFIYLYGFYGLCIRAIIIVIFDFIFSWYWRPIRVSKNWDRVTFNKLLKIGFPIFLVTSIYAKWPLVERTLILILLGTEALGLFTIVFVIGTGYNVFTSSISKVLYPTLMIEWGKGKSIGELVKTNLLKPLTLVIFLFLIIAPILWYILPLAISSFLPAYIDIIIASQWMVITGFISLFSILGIFYNVINVQKKRLFMYLSGVSGWAIILLIANFSEMLSFELFPQALAIGFIIMTLINVKFLTNNWFKTQNSY